MACVPSEDSDQPGHLPSLIRLFAVRMKKHWVISYPLSALPRLWSDWVDAQADPSLCWAHMPFCWFCHEAAHFYFYRSHTEAGWGDCRLEVKNVRGHGPYAQWLDGHYVSVKVGKFFALAALLDGTVKWSDDRQVKSEPSRLRLHPKTDVGWFPASNSPNLLLCWFCQLN